MKTQKEVGRNNMLLASKLKSTFGMDELPTLTISGWFDENCNFKVRLHNGGFDNYRVIIKQWVEGRDKPYHYEFSCYGGQYSTVNEVAKDIKKYYETQVISDTFFEDVVKRNAIGAA